MSENAVAQDEDYEGDEFVGTVDDGGLAKKMLTKKKRRRRKKHKSKVKVNSKHVGIKKRTRVVKVRAHYRRIKTRRRK